MSDEFIEKAMQHLPDNQKNKEFYVKNFTSPQFYDALNSLSSALNSENFGLILSSFGLSLADTGNKLGVEGLINALLKKYKIDDKVNDEKK